MTVTLTPIARSVAILLRVVAEFAQHRIGVRAECRRSLTRQCLAGRRNAGGTMRNSPCG